MKFVTWYYITVNDVNIIIAIWPLMLVKKPKSVHYFMDYNSGMNTSWGFKVNLRNSKIRYVHIDMCSIGPD